MRISNYKILNLKDKISLFREKWHVICLILLVLSAVLTFSRVSAQNSTEVTTSAPSLFPVGEHLSYKLSFEKFTNGGIAEFIVASKGKVGEREAVELQSKIKTTNLVSSAFFLLDESRTTFAAGETGLPLYVRSISNTVVLPQESIKNYLTIPTQNFDWLTLLYQVRRAGGVGIFPLEEAEKNYSVSFQIAGSERIKTDLGEFDTSISSVQSQFLIEKGIIDLRINFTNDNSKIPVLFRIKTKKGEFRAEITGILPSNTEFSNTPVVLKTPIPQITPKLIITSKPYIENQPLLPDLVFKLGETLEYQVSANGKFLGIVTLQAKERKLFGNQDSLLLRATVTGVEPNQQVLNLNDSIETLVNPETLSPYQFSVKLNGLFSVYNQSVLFNQELGKANINGTNPVDIPVGTHNLLSLIYAMRSFNLKPIKDKNNVIGETRVAVLLGSGANVFLLKPSEAEQITINNRKFSAQSIVVATGNPQLDVQIIRLWLGNDENRLPLRLTIGNIYQADLISSKIITPK
ncbi:hypothetical protein BH10ACI1_BH10ACI1_15800 [soil metagenome]